jgi:hypothetical protein
MKTNDGRTMFGIRSLARAAKYAAGNRSHLRFDRHMLLAVLAVLVVAMIGSLAALPAAHAVSTQQETWSGSSTAEISSYSCPTLPAIGIDTISWTVTFNPSNGLYYVSWSPSTSWLSCSYNVPGPAGGNGVSVYPGPTGYYWSSGGAWTTSSPPWGNSVFTEAWANYYESGTITGGYYLGQFIIYNSATLEP